MKYLFGGHFFDEENVPILSEQGKGHDTKETIRPKIVVGISLTPPSADCWEPGINVFPAILDTGCTAYFEIDAQHIFYWSGSQVDDYTEVENRPKRSLYKVCHGNVWLHRQPYTGPKYQGPPEPILLSGFDEIHVMKPRKPIQPRFPLLGLQALVWNKLVLQVNGATSEFEISRYQSTPSQGPHRHHREH